jgi:hypothetical protein
LLVRAADLIGQLGDPHCLPKTNALFYEFEGLVLIGNLATPRPPTRTNIRNSIDAALRHISKLPSYTSM